MGPVNKEEKSLMFRCHYCKKIVPPGTSAVHIVVETREVQYPSRGGRSLDTNKKTSRSTKFQDRGGSGVETVKEVLACPSCAKAAAKEQASQETAA